MDLYCRSALGNTTEFISAVAFANFYISEIETRYTTPIGTGLAAENMIKMLKRRKKVDLKTNATVGKIRNVDNGVEVYFVKDGKTQRARASFAVFAGTNSSMHQKSSRT